MIKITKNDLILLAAAKLPPLFSAEQLTVACWQMAPDRFGLEGYEKTYPHHNAVLLQLMGAKGLVRKGKLTQVGKGKTRRYKLAGR